MKVGDLIIQVTQFKYHGFILSTKNLGFIGQNDREIKADVNHYCIQVGLLKCRRASGVFCDTNVPFKLK